MNTIQNNIIDSFKDNIDWGVYKSQQRPDQLSNESENENINIGFNKKKSEKVNTHLPFFGEMPRPNLKDYFSPENIREATQEGLGAISGMNVLKSGKLIGSAAKKGMEYINPEAISEQLRGQFGQGTVSENIGELGQRVKFGKESAKEQALTPKRELMETIKGEEIVKPKPLKLEKVAKIFEPDVNNISSQQSDALRKAIANYYKSGNLGKLTEKGEQIFSHEGLESNQIDKLERLLTTQMPAKGRYLSDAEATKFYSSKGTLSELHKDYIKTKSPDVADQLMSELKSEIRKLKKIDRNTGLGDVQSERLASYESNLQNIENDFNKFISTLPKEAQGKYKQFTTSYRENVAPYKSEDIIREMSYGNTQGIQANEVESLFSNPNPTKDVKKVINDIGSSGWNNIVYNMLSKYEPGEASKMAKAILEGKRKGSPIITDEMVQAANNAIKRSRISTAVKTSARAAGGAALAAPFGLAPLGAIAGAASPYLLANKDLISKAIQRFKR